MESARDFVLQRLDGFDGFVEETMKEWKVPGVALSVVKDGELAYSKGYGYRDPEKGLEMNADTLYRIASNSKAFTAMSAALLVDEGKLDWNKPVQDYLPYFKLQDSYATKHVTLRDLLCHRTGLPAHDGASHHCKTRKEIVESLRYLEPSYSIRTKLQYNNKMYQTAGHLVEVIAGQPWESFVKERIFDFLGMEKSNFSFFKSRTTGNFAENFYMQGDELRQFKMWKDADPEVFFPGSPSGGINSTANEMANWMILQLNKGEFNGKRLVSEKAIEEMHSPQMVDNWNAPYEEFGESSSGLGWFIYGYRGHKIVIHGGFFGSEVYLVPRRNIGITVLPTLGSPLTAVLQYNLLDRLLELEPIDWNARRIKERDDALKNQVKAESDRKTGTKPSHNLTDYCGVFEHPAYGKFEFILDGESLYLKEENHTFEIRHYHYDTFEFINEDGDPEFRITFHTDAKGNVSTASAPFETAVKDIVFKRSV